MVSPDEISRRLKAARWLAGGVDEKGKPKELKVAELAQIPPLPENGITANRIEEIEQLKVRGGGPRPMELEKIARALGLPGDWFAAPDPVRRGDSLDLLQQALADLGLAPPPSGAEEPSAVPGTDRQEEAQGGAGA